jgi:hypothetical protein
MGEKSRIVGVAGGAFTLGGLAAALGLCCSAPWAVPLLGVAGAVMFARLAFLMPIALAGAVVLVMLGFWLAYRRPVCRDGVCDAPARRTLQWIVWLSALGVAALGWLALTYRVTPI